MSTTYRAELDECPDRAFAPTTVYPAHHWHTFIGRVDASGEMEPTDLISLVTCCRCGDVQPSFDCRGYRTPHGGS